MLKKYLTDNLEADTTKNNTSGCNIPIDLGTPGITYIVIMIEKV